jgi:preprotein translocase subunit SecF
MELIKPDVNIEFVGNRRIGYIVSTAMILVSLVALALDGGPLYGVDFSGGTVIQVRFGSPTGPSAVKEAIGALGMTSSSVQRFGDPADNEFLIRTDISEVNEEGLSSRLEAALETATGATAEVRRLEMVGPQVGKDLREKALFAMFYALLFITIYISGRFELKWMLSGVMAAALAVSVYLLGIFDVSIPFLMTAALFVTLVLFWFLELKYAMGAIVALIHDVTITIGLFAVFDKEFTLPIIAALLTIIGYSLNDTIIVFDRIRENLRKYPRNPLSLIINRSINETLSRTILTSLTTLVVVVTLFLLGGGIIHDFAFALLVGIVVGTYSSVFVASPILLIWKERKA